MNAQNLIDQILNNQIEFQGDDFYAAVWYCGNPCIMTNGYTDEWGEDFDGIINLRELDFETLEYIAKWKAWPMEEPTIYA